MPPIRPVVKISHILSFYLTLAVPLLYLFCLYVIAYYPNTAEFPLIVVLLGLASSLIGIFIWALSMYQLGNSFGVLPTTKTRVTTGLYQHYKHPMYLGITLTYLGLGLANQSSYGLLVTIVLLIPILILRARLEERQLKD